MKSALIIHGTCDKEEFYDKNMPSLSNSHWFPWLQKQLWLQDNPETKLEKLILVAPWLDIDKECTNFLDFHINDNVLNNIKETFLFYSTDDETSILDSVNKILSNYKNIKVYSFENKGHFVYSTIGPTFPELWNSIIE